MEAAVAPLVLAGDGGARLAANEAALERAEQPPSAAGSGPAWLAPRLRAGRRLWALLAHSPQIGLVHEALACAGASAELLGAGVCPRAGGRAGISFRGSRWSSRKPLLLQASRLLPDAHLLGCLLDCASGVLGEKPVPALLWKKPAGKELQSRGGQELMRSARRGLSLAESRTEPQDNSPGNRCGHRAPSLRFCTHRYPGQPLPGDTACMLEGREQMPLGMSTSAGLREASPKALALSTPSWPSLAGCRLP